MPDNRFYFPHDLHARHDFKVQAMIQDYGAAGVGIYWCLVEMLHEEEDNKLPLKRMIYQAIGKQLNTDAQQIETFISKCISEYELLKEQDGYFFSKRVMDNMQRRKEISEKRSASGKAGASAKQLLANAKHLSATAKQMPGKRQQLSGKIKQRKGKEIKVKEIREEVVQVISYLNEKTGKGFSPESEKTQVLIVDLLDGGTTVDEIKSVIAIKSEKWRNDEKMRDFLRPETLFGPKFEGYLNEITPDAGTPSLIHLKPVDHDQYIFGDTN